MVTDREAFEALIEAEGGDLRTFGSGKNMHYLNSAVNNAWTGWQARAALAAPPSPATAVVSDEPCAQCGSAGYPCDTCGRGFAAPPVEQQARALTYSSTQATECAGCGVRKHTPLRIDAMGGYVCLTCISNKLGSMLGEFGHPEPAQPAPQAGAAEPALRPDIQAVLLELDVPVQGYLASHAGTFLKHAAIMPPEEYPIPLVRESDHRRACRKIAALATHPNEQPSQDAERLDWVIRQGEEFRCFVITDAPGDGEYAAWGDGMDAHGKGKTAREAIDAARTAQAQRGAA